MAELKTKKTDASVEEFLSKIEDEETRSDCDRLVKIMSDITKAPPKMWGTAIIGFGDYHYKYATGREGDWFLMGFSPRKRNLTLYLSCGTEWPSELSEKLGKHSLGKGCLYVKRLDDLHLPTLKKLMRDKLKELRARPQPGDA